MARRKKTEDNISYNYSKREANGSVGLSAEAQKALDTGTYGKTNDRTMKYRTSQEQTIPGKSLPVLEGVNNNPDEWQSSLGSKNKAHVDTTRARAKYEQRIGHTPIGKALTEKDKAILYNGALRMLNNNMTAAEAANDIMTGSSNGNAGMMQGYARNKDWKAEYGKSLEELIDEYANNESAMKRHTEEIAHSDGDIAKTLGSTYMNAFVKPVVGAKAAIKNLINPDSKGAENANELARIYSDMSNIAREDVKKGMSDTGKTVYDVGTNVADRVLPYLLPGGKGIGAVGTLFRTAEDKRESLEGRGITGRGAIGQSLVSGGVDAALDVVGLEKIKGLSALKESGNLVKAALGSAAIGGGEQAITKAVDEAVDLIANGKDSVYSVNKQNYINQGMSEDEAQTTALLDEVKAFAQETGQGALFGTVMGVGGKAVNKALNKVSNKIPALTNDADIQKAQKQQADAVNEIQKLSEQIPEGWTAEDLENSVENASKVKNKAKAKSTDTFEYVTTDGKYTLSPTDNGWEIKGADGTSSKVKGGFDKAKSQLDDIYKTTGVETIPDVVPQKRMPASERYSIQTVYAKDGSPRYFVRENTSDTGSKPVEPGKVYKTEAEAQKVIDNLNNQIPEEPNVQTNNSGNLQERLNNLEDKTRYKAALTEQKNALKRDKSNYENGNLTSDAEKRIAQIDEQIKKTQDEISELKGQKRAEPTPNEPLPVDDSGIVPPDGNIPPNGNVPPEGGDKIRSFSKRGSQDETLPDEIRNTLSEDYYKVLHNADVEARADSLFVPENLTQTRSNLDRAVKSHDPASALLSYKLAKAYVDNGDYDAATDVLENVSAELTRMGQFTQAAKLAMLQNDPMAAMRSYMRDLEKLNEWGNKKYKGKWNNLELSEEDIDAISKIQKGDKDALNAITDQLNEKFARQIPANWWDKAVGASKTAMLLNLRTQSRNILANMATLPIRSASDRVSAVGQNIVHLFNPDMKVTQSVLGGTKEQKAIAEQIFEQKKAGILGENKMKDSVKSDILSQRQIFNDDAFATWVDNLTNGGIQKLNQKFGANGNKSTMETLQNLTYWLMGDIGDTPFVKKNFVNRLASYMKAQGINKIEDVPDDAIAIATQEALKATFKDDNAFTKALQGIKQKTGKFGEVALPFVKTPANLTMRAIDYSPAGLINTFRKIKSGADANAVVDELSKNLTGSAMIFLGYKLAEKGLLSGSYSDDPDEAQFQRQQGMLENAIHIGDKYFTYDWTQPAATPLVLGQTIYEAVKASDKQNAEVKDVVNAMFKGGLDVADTVINSSPLQSLADIMGGDEYSDKSVARNVANEIIEFPQRFVPSVLGATARTIDPVMRDTYIDDDSLTGTIGNNLRQIESKIPFLSKRLPVSYDTWGNPRTRSDSVGEAFVAQMVNPGTMGNKNETPLDAEIQRLFDATGNNAVFPAKAGRSLDLGNDGNLTLTNRQHSEYQKALGKKSYSYVEAITKSDEYKNLSDDQKASIIAKAYKLSNAMVKEEMFKHTTDDDKKLKEVARTGDANAVAKYLLDKNKADNLGINMDKYQKLESEAPGSAEQWMADKDNALNMGFTKKDGTANMKAYYNGVEYAGDDPNSLKAYADYRAQGFDNNADRTEYLMNDNSLTDEQKGRIMGGLKPEKMGKTAKGMYDLDGYAGVWSYYVLKGLADTDGNGRVSKKESDALLNSDNPYVTALPDDQYYFLAGTLYK